ncbi:hypothetical protein EDD18DRAFT_1177033, partial [Armillaria luteobubalina]
PDSMFPTVTSPLHAAGLLDHVASLVLHHGLPLASQLAPPSPKSPLPAEELSVQRQAESSSHTNTSLTPPMLPSCITMSPPPAAAITTALATSCIVVQDPVHDKDPALVETIIAVGGSKDLADLQPPVEEQEKSDAVSCGSKGCETIWFHLECLQLDYVSVGWHCDACTRKKGRQ